MKESEEIIESFTNQEYKEGFVSNIEQEYIPKGLTEETIRLISGKKGEPELMLEFRLKDLERWK